MKFGLFTLFDYFPEIQKEREYYDFTISMFKEAEALGFEQAWVGEEHFYSFGICPCPQLFLAALARETTTMRLGTAISVLPLEHPLRKAEQFAMLDVLSNGRLDFGAGTGGIPAHFAGFGENPAESRGRYEEALDIIEKSWRTTSLAYDGQFWKFDELSVSPRPVQAPCPPIYRGTLSVSGMTLAGQKGHSLQIPNWMIPDHVIEEGLVAYREALVANGHGTGGKPAVPPPAFMFFLFCSQDRNAALAEAREVVLRYRDLLARNFPLDAGKILPPGDSLRGLYDMLVTTEDALEERIICGTPSECREQIIERRDRYGIEHMNFYMHAGARNFHNARESLRLFANEVMPEFTATKVLSEDAALA